MVSNIWVAAADNQIEVVKGYLDSGEFSANAKDANGYTPIHAAASYGHTELLKFLISRGGDISIQDEEGDTPLHHVEDVDMARIMVQEYGADWKVKNRDGQTAAEYIDEEGEFPELAQYLHSLSHSLSGGEGSDLLSTLPTPGTFDGHEIRYSMEREETPVDAATEEERRRTIEAIINSENPEEALRDLVENAVHEGMTKYKQQEGSNSGGETTTKKRK